MSVEIPNKSMWQKNRRYMAWSALLIMAIVTALVIAFPSHIKPAEGIIVTIYLSLSGLVGAYFGFANVGKKK